MGMAKPQVWHQRIANPMGRGKYLFKLRTMKRIYFIIVLLHAIVLQSIGQSDNTLNTLIVKSVIDYTKDYNEFAKRVHYDTIQFICIDGLPKDIAFDSIPLGVFSLQWMEGNPTQVKKKFRHFTNDIRVTTKLSGNKIDIFISVYEVRRPRKRRTQIMVDGESGKHYLSEYSCETNDWQMI